MVRIMVFNATFNDIDYILYILAVLFIVGENRSTMSLDFGTENINKNFISRYPILFF